MSDVQLRLSGSGGQGLQLAAEILTSALSQGGYRIARSQSYEPTSRGGLSRSDLVVSKGAVDYPLVTDLDYLLVLDQIAVKASTGLIRPSTVVLMDSDRAPTPPESDCSVISLPLIRTAREAGNSRGANIVSLAVLAEQTGFCSREALRQAILSSMPARLAELNLETLTAGFTLVETVRS